MTYNFTDDSALMKEYHNALKEKPARENKTLGDRLPYFTLNEGESAEVRVVQLSGQATFVKQAVCFVAKVNCPGITIPPKIKYVTYADHPDCISHKIMSRINEEKLKYDFESAENKKYFMMKGTVEPTPVLYMVVIDRRDGLLKIWNTNKATGEEVLEIATDPESGGPIAHPKTGYNLKLKKKDKKTWTVKKGAIAPLSKDEIVLVENCTYTWDWIKSKATLEGQAGLGITVKGSNESTGDQGAEVPSNEHEEASHSTDSPPALSEDDIPF